MNDAGDMAGHAPDHITQVARFRIGRHRLAVDARLVEQVLPGPFVVTPLPLAPVHVPGAIRVREAAIPLLDVEALFGEPVDPASRTDAALTLVIRHPGGRFAVPVAALVGLARCTASQLSAIQVQQPTAGGVFTTLFTAPGDEGVDVLLDVHALARIAELHSVLATADYAGAGQAERERLCFVVQVGERRIAFDGQELRQLQRQAEIDRVALAHPGLLGFASCLGERVAVVALEALLGSAEPADAQVTPPLVVLDGPTGVPVALAVTAILDMERVPDSAVRALAAGDRNDDRARSVLWRGVFDSPRHGTLLLADGVALAAAATVVDTRALFATTPASSAVVAGTDAPVESFLVYRVAGGLLASGVRDARAVLPMPADFVDLRGAAPHAVGLFTHTHGVIRVVDLAALMSRPAVTVPVGRPVLVISTTSGLVGLLVDDVLFMRLASSRPLPGASGTRYGVLPPFGRTAPMPVDGTERAVTILDLAALARDPAFLQQLAVLASGEEQAHAA